MRPHRVICVISFLAATALAGQGQPIAEPNSIGSKGPAVPLFVAQAPRRFSQPPAPAKHAVYLRVQRVSSKLNSQNVWSTDDGSYEQNYNRVIGIEIEIRNMTSQPDEFLVGWFFIARRLSDKKSFIFDYGKKTVALPANQFIKAGVTSQPIESKTTVVNDLDYGTTTTEQTGCKIEGYVVLVKDGGQLLAYSASLPQLEGFMKTDQAAILMKLAVMPRIGRFTGRDTNMDGYLNRDEFFPRAGYSPRAEAAFRRMDKNGDDKLSIEEFFSYYK